MFAVCQTWRILESRKTWFRVSKVRWSNFFTQKNKKISVQYFSAHGCFINTPLGCFFNPFLNLSPCKLLLHIQTEMSITEILFISSQTLGKHMLNVNMLLFPLRCDLFFFFFHKKLLLQCSRQGQPNLSKYIWLKTCIPKINTICTYK